MDTLSACKAMIPDETSGDRIERVRQAGLKAKREVQKKLRTNQPGSPGAEKASSRPSTSCHSSDELTDDSGYIAPSSQLTEKSGATGEQSAKGSGNDSKVYVELFDGSVFR